MILNVHEQRRRVCREVVDCLPIPQKLMGLFMMCIIYRYIRNFNTNQQVHTCIFPFYKSCIVFNNLQQINVQGLSKQYGKE
jgi:hypothetical protein